MPARRCDIAFLEDRVAGLPEPDRELFHRIFHVSTAIGSLAAPHSMRPWIESQFGSLDAVQRQRIVKVTNLITLEGALFNELRADRPIDSPGAEDVEGAIRESAGDAFCRVLTDTPEDVFGRIRGRHAATASNVAKYDGFHGVVIFDEHDPLSFSEAQVASYLDTALEWAAEAQRWDPDAKYFFFMWNCLWKSGASIIHGHAQMTLGRGLHYAKVEAWRRAAQAYQARHGNSYFQDLVRVHSALDLSWRWGGADGLAYLTPIKENELLLISDELDVDLKRSIHRVLRCLVEAMGARSFNLALYMPPLSPAPESWEGFPVIVRIVDRGDPMNRTSDMGAMELYASSIVESDPFRVARIMRSGAKRRPDRLAR